MKSSESSFKHCEQWTEKGKKDGALTTVILGSGISLSVSLKRSMSLLVLVGTRVTVAIYD